MSSAAVACGEQPMRRRRTIADEFLALGWVSIGVAQIIWPHVAVWADPPSSEFASAGVLSLVLVFAVCVPVFWWRRAPLRAFVFSWAALACLVMTDHQVGLLPFVAWILVYGVGVFASRRDRAVATVIVVAGVAIARASSYPQFDTMAAVRNAVLLTVCLTLGSMSAAARRSAHDRVALAEQRSIVATQRAEAVVIDERLRLARELHDVVAHSMSVISVQSAMASAAFDTHPDRSRRALLDIERTSRATVSELRGLLGVLRSDDGSPSMSDPAPSLRDLDAVVENVEGIGLDVRLTRRGAFALPPGVDAFAYRIVQEALTNVVKHAQATAVAVEIVDDGRSVTLSIADNGRSVVGDVGVGLGLLGMGERARAFGGVVQAGAAKAGGFVVTATLPYAFAAPSEAVT